MSEEEWLFLFAALGALASILTILRFTTKGVKAVGSWSRNQQFAIPAYGLAVILMLAIGSFAISVIGFVETHQLKRATELQNLMVAWGGNQSRNGYRVTFLGRKLDEFATKYDVVLICGFEDKITDPNDQQNIAVSKPFEITDHEMTIEDTFTSQMLGQIRSGEPVSVWYRLALLPKKADGLRIEKLRDVEKLGGAILNP